MYKLVLCLRYLRTRYIALASIVSVMLGVATMIVVNSVMSGFATEMRDRLQGLLSDIIIDTRSMDGEPNPEALLAEVRKVAGDYVEGVTATVEIYGMLSFQYGGNYITRPVTLIGIDPQSKSEVGPLVDHLVSYQPEREDGKVVSPPERDRSTPPGWNLSPAASAYRREIAERRRWLHEQLERERTAHQGLSEPANADAEAEASAVAGADDDVFGTKSHPTPKPAAAEDPAAPMQARIYIGAQLVSYQYDDQETGKSRTMQMVRAGDDVKISTVTAGRPPEAAHFNATVVDFFRSGMSEYDSQLVFCDIKSLQQARGMFDRTSGSGAVTSIQIKLKDVSKTADVIARLKTVFPATDFTINTWESKQAPLLAAVEIESAILNVLLFLIITVAGFGILAIFFMIVVEKTRDIGILKALGASSSGVMSIFLSYGLSLGMVGSGVGVACGLLFVHYINEIETILSWITGRKVFDERIYYFPTIPTNVDALTVCWVASGAVAIAVMASILPARRAARLHPVQALRYE